MSSLLIWLYLSLVLLAEHRCIMRSPARKTCAMHARFANGTHLLLCEPTNASVFGTEFTSWNSNATGAWTWPSFSG